MLRRRWITVALALTACASSHQHAAPPPPSAPAASATTAAPDGLSTRERVGQLFMLGLSAKGPSAADVALLTADSAGNAYLKDNTTAGVAAVKAITDRLTPVLTHHGVRPFLATDQEGGQVQELQGPGFSRMPTAVEQGAMPVDELEASARTWGAELRAAGITLDLAPVADVVPASVGRSNKPIGSTLRELGSDPTGVGEHAAALVRGFTSARVLSTLKHFPGLGEASGNTDSQVHVTAPTTAEDLAAFNAGISAGAPFVMVSSATYPAIDPTQAACFSSMVIKDLLRGREKFTGIVISDSFGSASLSTVTPAQRAVRFFRAGGTMIVSSAPSQFFAMFSGVLQEMTRDKAFAATIDADVDLVLAAKERAGLTAQTSP